MIRLDVEEIEYSPGKRVIIVEYALGRGSLFVVDVHDVYDPPEWLSFLMYKDEWWRAASRCRAEALHQAVEKRLLTPEEASNPLAFSYWKWGIMPSWWIPEEGEPGVEPLEVEAVSVDQLRLFE